MIERKVTCVIVDDPGDDPCCVRTLGLTNPSQRVTREEAWGLITNHNQQLYVEAYVPAVGTYVKAYLEPRTTANGTRYVRTEANGHEETNLLNQPKCR